MSIENIRLSQTAKDQLLKLKRYTKIAQWNILCRWGFCVSLAEPTMPTPVKIPADSSVEMTWKVFGGSYHETYLALLKARLLRDKIELAEDELATHFRLHLHRGISYLASERDLRSIMKLVARALPEA